jgi:glycosyltransferase involved in cell wall biosynthesis
MEALVINQALLNLDKQQASVASSSKLSLPVALIPAYKPEKVLCKIARALIQGGKFHAVVVVNDGSGDEYNSIFVELSKIKGIFILKHEINQGKGAALKTGFSFIQENFPKSIGIVTADADGQHDPKDVNNIALELGKAPHNIILGARTFEGNIPFRSRFGNIITRHVLSLFSHQTIKDTQTGLRGIPAQLINILKELRPNGYNYELEMLITCKRLGVKIKEVGIRTIYINANKSSHFKPVLDSLRIYSVFLKFIASSLLAAILDNAIFACFFFLSSNILFSQVFARAIVVIVNYFTNKRAVFHSQTKNLISLPRYLGLVVFLLVTSYSLITVVVSWFNINVLIAKIGVESTLFLVSFIVQKIYVFKTSKDSSRIVLQPTKLEGDENNMALKSV